MNFLDLNEMIHVKPNDKYNVKRIGDHEGPNHTNTTVGHVKLWCRQ